MVDFVIIAYTLKTTEISIHETAILPLVLYVCEMRCYTSKEGNKLQMLQNNLSRKYLDLRAMTYISNLGYNTTSNARLTVI